MGKLNVRCFCYFLPAMLVPLHSVSIQSSISLARLFTYQSSFIFQLLELIYWMVMTFIFDGLTMLTSHHHHPHHHHHHHHHNNNNNNNNTVKPLLSGPSIKRTLGLVPKLTSYISLQIKPLFSGHLHVLSGRKH